MPILVLLVVVGCKGGSRRRSQPEREPSPAPRAVGRLRVDAAAVRVNDRPVTGTVPLFIGDKVRTESTGRATIFFDAGGSLVLGPNTDPDLQLVNVAACVGMALLVSIRIGTFDFLNVTRVCFCDLQNEVCGRPQSDFRVVITSSGASITVKHGALRVTVGGRPPRQKEYFLTQGQSMVVQKGKTPGPRRPSPSHGRSPIIK